MKRISINSFWPAGILLFLALALLAPYPVAAKEPSGKGIPKERIAQDLGLTGDKAQAFLAVGDRYHRTREEIIERIRKHEEGLEQAMAAPQPDDAKIKGLVAAITADHNKLWDTLRVQRQEEMALLTPMQQAKYLMALKKWHQEMCLKYEKQEKK